MKQGAQNAALAAWLVLGAAASAHAHAPLPRGLAVESDASGGVAVRMPGFGWLVRDRSASAFAYACDALLGVSPLEEHVPMAYRSDGALLVGTSHGVRALGRDGCPTSTAALQDVQVAALAVHGGASGRVYAVTTSLNGPAVVQRSDDGGEHWLAGAALAALPVTGLALDASNAQRVYVSQTLAVQRAAISVSSDGGATFVTFEHERALTLLHVQASPARVWAISRIANRPQGVHIVRASGAQGPWQEVLEVNFFGGFAVDPADPDVIWVGDEARGVFRSSDGGEHFVETQPDEATACLAYGAGALWGCTPGLPEQTALARSSDAIAPFEPVMAFADVGRLVDCAPAIDVGQVCAAPWIEWQRDVLAIQPMPAPSSDAGADAARGEADAARSDATNSDAASGDATSGGVAIVDAGSGGAVHGSHAGERPIAARERPASCGVSAPRTGGGWLLWMLGAAAWLRIRASSRHRVMAAMDTTQRVCEGAATHRMSSDTELMARAAGGDPEAFALIYDRHAGALLALAQRMLGRSDEALDLLHDVFLEAWQHVREYDASRATPRTWLIVRLRSRALDRLARSVRGAGVAQQLEAFAAVAPDSLGEQQRDVARALATLDAGVRRVLELTYFDGLTAVEIGERDGTPIGTVRSRLARGLEQLRALLTSLKGASDE